MTHKTCIECRAATPSDVVRGMLNCVDSRASGELRGQFSYRCVSFAAARRACSFFSPRKEPIAFVDEAQATAAAAGGDFSQTDAHFLNGADALTGGGHLAIDAAKAPKAKSPGRPVLEDLFL